MSAWAEVDALKQSVTRRARQHAYATDTLREQYRRGRAERAARRNVERWFRELPADFVQGMIGESTGTMHADAGLLCVANDWLLEHGFSLKTPRPLRPLTSRERLMLRALKACRFPPASFSKRFVRELGDDLITDGQAAQVRRLIKTFRRQIPLGALHESDRHLLSKKR